MNESSHPVVICGFDDLLAGGADCDCACPSVQSMANVRSLSSDIWLCSYPHQQQIALSPEYNVVFVPSISRVAVVNTSALDLLRRFDVPRPVHTVVADELATVQLLYNLNLLVDHDASFTPPTPPDELTAWLHVTNACNLRCTYCYIDKTDEAMSTETAFAAIDAVLGSARLHGYRQVYLKYAGGEASLNLLLVTQMHQYAQSQAVSYGIGVRGVVLSNGVGLTSHKLRQIRNLGLRLMISLDGPQQFHDVQRPRLGGQGSFDAVIASIERARDLALDLTVSVTVTGVSVDGLPKIVAWLLEREIHFSLNWYRECDASVGFDALKLDEQRLIEGMLVAYREIEQRLPGYSLLGCLLDRTNLGVPHRRTCGAGENYLVIDHHGSVSKCQMEITQPVTTVWEADPLLAIRLDPRGVQNLPVEYKEGCRDCEWQYWCAGGCAIATYRATGRYDIKSPNCSIYKALYPEVLRLEGKRLLHWHQRETC